ncbi:MAG: glycine oxidase ThiO [Dehalococcoidia bacterium]|nr:glycine oxidase ThiO [Dehalococcoidia bacterium]
MEQRADVIIVGGGVIGCSIAYYLGKAGVKAMVLESGELGGEASKAAAGMLAPLSHTTGPSPFLDLCMAGLRSFKDLPDELREASGIDIEYIPRGIIEVAFNDEEKKRLKRLLNWQVESGLEIEWLDTKELRAIEPALSPDIIGGMYYPEEHQVRATRLVQAFAHGAAKHGAGFKERSAVIGIIEHGHRVEGVRTTGEEFYADAVVFATGAWTDLYEGLLQIKLPVFPVRGQTVVLRKIPSPVRHSIGSSRGYLVPKVDGTIIVGATVEAMGFDKRLTAAGIASMLEIAPRLIPELADADFLGGVVGLRPGSSDGLPILGQVPGWEGLYLASGHGRDGILLSAITGKLISELITRGDTAIDLAPFSLARFMA